MSEMNPNALSLEDAPAHTIETPPIVQPSAEPDAQAVPDDAEPEGVVEHQGKRLVDVSVLAAERRRMREVTAAAKEKEFAPVREEAQRAKQLEAALAEVRPIIEHVRQHGLPKAPAPTPVEEQISEEDAAQEARDLELYRADGQPDVVRAKRIIARRRTETSAAAKAAAEAAVGPMRSDSAEEASRRNLERLALQRDSAGTPVLQRSVDPKILAQLWAQLPAELTAHPEVADLVMNAAIGATIRRRGSVARPERDPTLSEPSGGGSGPRWQMDTLTKGVAQAAGMSEKKFAESAAAYKPGQTNVLGD